MYKSRYKKASSRIKKRSKTKHFFSLIFKIGLPVILIVGAVFLLRADFMQLKSVEVVGNQDIPSDVIERLTHENLLGSRLFFIPKSNFFIFNSRSLEQKILTNFPRVESVEVSKDLDGIIHIILSERQKDFVWCATEEACFLMSKDGRVFAEAGSEEILGRIIFKGNIYGKPISQNFAVGGDMQNYLKVIGGLQNSGLQVFSVTTESPNKAVVKTGIGDIFLNPEENMSLSIPNITLLIQEIQSQNPSARFNYIDARFGTKVFYKLQASD